MMFFLSQYQSNVVIQNIVFLTWPPISQLIPNVEPLNSLYLTELTKYAVLTNTTYFSKIPKI